MNPACTRQAAATTKTTWAVAPLLLAGTVLWLSACADDEPPSATAPAVDGDRVRAEASDEPTIERRGPLAGTVAAIPSVARPGQDVGVVVINEGESPLRYGLDLRLARQTPNGWEDATHDIYGMGSSGARAIQITVPPGGRSGPRPAGLEHKVPLREDASPGRYRILLVATGRGGAAITLQGTFRVVPR